MVWIQPLELETWIINVFSGSHEIFLGVAMFFVFGGAAYFKMSTLGMFLMLAVFLIMFSAFMANYLILIMGVVGGLVVGYWVSRIVKR